MEQTVHMDVSRIKLVKLEAEITMLSGISIDEFKSKDQFISNTEYIHYLDIRKHNGNQSKVLLLIHGYGASSCIFFKMIKHLYEHFRILIIDLPGMGMSSRTKETPFDSTTSCIDYFVGRINLFCEQMNLSTFYLAGHSIGAYIAAHFFSRFPKKVIQLYLISPAGFNQSKENQKQHTMETIKRFSFWGRIFAKNVAKKIFDNKKSIFETIWSPFRSFALKKYFGNPRFKFSEKEKNLLIEFYKIILTLPPCSERCLGYLLNYGPKSDFPIIEAIFEHDLERVSIYYGENDWMDKNDTLKSCKEKLVEIQIEHVANSDHQIILQNPLELSNKIVEKTNEFISKTKDFLKN